MLARRPTPRTRYDGTVFRSLRETHKVGLATILHTANQQVGFEVCTHEHVRQWERGQRNISARIAHVLATALAQTTGATIGAGDFEAPQAAA